MKKIDKVIAKVEEMIEFNNNPGGYMDTDYYIQCRAKVDVLEELMWTLKELKE